MKTRLRSLLVLALAFSVPSVALAQGSAFTYQGRLTVGTNGANGIYDLRFGLFNALSSGAQIGPSLTNTALAVSNGFFTVTLDFANGVFPGADRWLEIGVRTNGNGAFTTLTSRQKITPTPYAITASNLIGTLAASQLTGALPSAQLGGTYSAAVTLNNAANSYTGNGSGLNNLNASQLTSGTIPLAALVGAWKTNGNAGANPTNGAFLGTTDNLPLEFKVNGVRALRLEPTTNDEDHLNVVNVIGGSPGNFVSNGVRGATISGGGAVNVNYTGPNGVTADFGTVAGGDHNHAFGAASTVSGGHFNSSSGSTATVGGGQGNSASGSAATVAGGYGNSASDYFATVGGGVFNAASGSAATVAGGNRNTASGANSFAAGYRAKAINDGSFVWADSTDADFATTADNQFLIRASGGVGIGTTAPGKALQVGDASVNGSEGMIRLASRTITGAGVLRTWEIGVPQTGDDAGGQGYSFVIRDADNLTTNAPFIVRYDSHYVGIGTNLPQSALHVVGTVTATAFNPSSDRNLKENFAPVSPREVLDKVAAMPISRWNFISDGATPHVGPMAQDFHAAFGLGTDDKHIATVDADGVALAAIQGLNQKLNEKEVEIQDLKRSVADLKKMVQVLAEKK